MHFESLGEIMDVDFVLADASQLQFYAQLPVESLDLSSIEEFATPQKSLVAPMSTLLSGVLYFDSLDGERHPLRNGEQIRFTVAQGRLESLRLLDDRIAFKFRGRINALSVGDEEARRNLMPSLLQWLRARQPLSLIWGAAIFVYGLLLTVLRWYRSSP